MSAVPARNVTEGFRELDELRHELEQEAKARRASGAAQRAAGAAE